MLKILTTLMLIVALVCSGYGQTSFQTVHTGKDTLVLVPVQSIKACNAVKAFSDTLKFINAEKDTLITDLKEQNSALKKQSKVLNLILEESKRQNFDLANKNKGLEKDLNEGKILIRNLIYVATIEAAILITIFIWR